MAYDRSRNAAQKIRGENESVFENNDRVYGPAGVIL
jgi:hypothetical protein